MRRYVLLLTVALCVAIAGQGVAATQTVLGKRLSVKDPKPGTAPAKRAVAIDGKELVSSASVVGDPVANGATIQVIATGGTTSSQVFWLPPGALPAHGTLGWKTSGYPPTAYSYKDKLGAAGPVKAAKIGKNSNGTFTIKVQVAGKLGPGPQPQIYVLPPNPGTAGAVVFSVTDGDRYCMTFGGASGGKIVNTPANNPSEAFQIVSTTSEPTTKAEPCPGPMTFQKQVVPDLPGLPVIDGELLTLPDGTASGELVVTVAGQAATLSVQDGTIVVTLGGSTFTLFGPGNEYGAVLDGVPVSAEDAFAAFDLAFTSPPGSWTTTQRAMIAFAAVALTPQWQLNLVPTSAPSLTRSAHDLGRSSLEIEINWAGLPWCEAAAATVRFAMQQLMEKGCDAEAAVSCADLLLAALKGGRAAAVIAAAICGTYVWQGCDFAEQSYYDAVLAVCPAPATPTTSTSTTSTSSTSTTTGGPTTTTTTLVPLNCTLGTSWGTFGDGDGQLDRPGHIAIWGGTIFVTEMRNRVQAFTLDGTFLSSWAPGPALYQAGAIAADGDGVYVTDPNNVADPNYDLRILSFTGDGTLITSWGGYGTEDGKFGQPTALAIGIGGDVYVVDNGNQRVQVFTGSGTFLRAFGSHGFADGQFNGAIFGIAVDGGTVFVLESSHVYKFTTSGTFLQRWGSEGYGDGQFVAPGGIAVDGNGDVWVDGYGGRVQKFTNTGTFLGKFNIPIGYPGDMAVAGNGDIYVVNSQASRILKFHCP